MTSGGTPMPVAPFQSCIACLRGDTTTGFVARGHPTWIAAVIVRTAGLSVDEADATVLFDLEQRGIAPDAALDPHYRLETGVRLCRDCAQKTNTPVGELADEAQLAAFVQPEGPVR